MINCPQNEKSLAALATNKPVSEKALEALNNPNKNFQPSGYIGDSTVIIDSAMAMHNSGSR